MCINPFYISVHTYACSNREDYYIHLINLKSSNSSPQAIKTQTHERYSDYTENNLFEKDNKIASNV